MGTNRFKGRRLKALRIREAFENFDWMIILVGCQSALGSLAALLTLGFVIYRRLGVSIFHSACFHSDHTSADRKRGSCTSWPRCAHKYL